MKKNLLAAALLTALPVAAQADLLFTIGAKASIWDAEPTGQLDKGLSVENDGLNLGSENGQQFSIFFEHPIPVLPNIKLKSTSLEVDGKGNINNANFAGQPFNGNVTTKVDLSHNDLTLYWGVPLPIPYLDINFGLTARQFTGDASVSDTTAGTEKVDLDLTLPMAYGEIKLGSFFGVYAAADINYVSYKDNKLTDMSAVIGYELPIPIPMLDIGLEAGYRSMGLQTDTDDVDIAADLDVKGLTYGLSLTLGF